MNQRWHKVKSAAQRAGVSERKFRDLLKDGLRHIRLPSGLILTKDVWIDEYLERFEVAGDSPEVNRIVDEVCKAMEI